MNLNIVYTALFGDAKRDTVRAPTQIDRETNYLVFSDLPQSYFPSPYVVLPSQAPIASWEPRKQARWHKVNSCLLLKSLFGKEFAVNPVFSVWHDASFQLTDLPANIQKHRGEAQLAISTHRERRCYAEEAHECSRLKLADPAMLLQQTQRYSKRGYPPNSGLWETGILIRDNSSWRTATFEDIWWHEIDNFTLRDQVSFPYAMSSSSLVVTTLPIITQLPFALYHTHNGKGKKRT